jgi:hypothetical protein
VRCRARKQHAKQHPAEPLPDHLQKAYQRTPLSYVWHKALATELDQRFRDGANTSASTRGLLPRLIATMRASHPEDPLLLELQDQGLVGDDGRIVRTNWVAHVKARKAINNTDRRKRCVAHIYAKRHAADAGGAVSSSDDEGAAKCN